MSELDEKNKALTKEFFELVNKMGNDKDLADVISDHLRYEHRTLQGSFWRIVKLTATRYADENEEYADPRNEVAVELAKEIRDSKNYPPFV